jgi:hypothetical protein
VGDGPYSTDVACARAGVALSDTPPGPYRYHGSLRSNGGMNRDQTHFQDKDGAVYPFCSSEHNATMPAARLREDFLEPIISRSAPGYAKATYAPGLFQTFRLGCKAPLYSRSPDSQVLMFLWPTGGKKQNYVFRVMSGCPSAFLKARLSRSAGWMSGILRLLKANGGLL